VHGWKLKPKNTFYSTFDKETYGPRKAAPYRSPFQVDRDRVLHSYAFRRLQAKTQVFRPGEYDFYRTRLTHTIEVAQIGRSICSYLIRTSRSLNESFFIDPDLVEAICLAHDIGHPPFGHAGERTLDKLMANYGGFEGNAQTLRLLTETIRSDPDKDKRVGMEPTRALLDGVLKYKRLRSRTQGNPKFIYDEQEPVFAFVHPNQPTISEKWKSIECQIMEWADDVAYSVADLVDGVRARFIDPEKLRNWQGNSYHKPTVEKLIKVLREKRLSDFAADKIGEFIESCSLRPTKNHPLSATSNRYKFDLEVQKDKKSEQKCLNSIAVELVFKSPGVQQLEFKAQTILKYLYRTLARTYVSPRDPKIHLLPVDIERSFERAPCENDRARLLTDHISGMSDEYAIRTYRRLIEPEFGSIVDLV
jgi:dGTPase